MGQVPGLLCGDGGAIHDKVVISDHPVLTAWLAEATSSAAFVAPNPRQFG
ncbi:MAG: hypothetical protein ACSLE1_16900 [Sphingobium sp.]